MPDQEQNTVQTQDAGTDDFATWEAQRNAELTGESGAGDDTPAAESADESETSEKTEESEGKEPEGDEDGDEPEEKPKEDKPKRKGGFQKKIDALTRKNHELAERLAALEKGGDKAEKPAAKTTDDAEDDPKPKSEDFDSFDEFTEAMTDWKIRQREQARVAEEAAAKAKAETESQRKAIGQSYVEQEKAVKAKYEDFDEVMEAAEEVEAPQYLLDLLLEAGPEVAYHLAKDLDNAARIAKLGPTAAAREIGKIEAQIAKEPAKETPKTQPTKKTTSAPKPARSLTGNSAQPKGIDDPDTPYDEWEKARNRQLLQGR